MRSLPLLMPPLRWELQFNWRVFTTARFVIHVMKLNRTHTHMSAPTNDGDILGYSSILMQRSIRSSTVQISL